MSQLFLHHLCQVVHSSIPGFELVGESRFFSLSMCCSSAVHNVESVHVVVSGRTHTSLPEGRRLQQDEPLVVTDCPGCRTLHLVFILVCRLGIQKVNPGP